MQSTTTLANGEIDQINYTNGVPSSLIKTFPPASDGSVIINTNDDTGTQLDVTTIRHSNGDQIQTFFTDGIPTNVARTSINSVDGTATVDRYDGTGTMLISHAVNSTDGSSITTNFNTDGQISSEVAISATHDTTTIRNYDSNGLLHDTKSLIFNSANGSQTFEETNYNATGEVEFEGTLSVLSNGEAFLEVSGEGFEGTFDNTTITIAPNSTATISGTGNKVTIGANATVGGSLEGSQISAGSNTTLNLTLHGSTLTALSGTDKLKMLGNNNTVFVGPAIGNTTGGPSTLPTLVFNGHNNNIFTSLPVSVLGNSNSVFSSLPTRVGTGINAIGVNNQMLSGSATANTTTQNFFNPVTGQFSSVQNAYNSNGDVIATVTTNYGPNGEVTSSTTSVYGSNGDVISSSTSNYDANGNVIGSSSTTVNPTTGEPTTVTNQYDSNGNITQSLTVDGSGNLVSSSTYQYSPDGNLVIVTTENGNGLVTQKTTEITDPTSNVMDIERTNFDPTTGLAIGQQQIIGSENGTTAILSGQVGEVDLSNATVLFTSGGQGSITGDGNTVMADPSSSVPITGDSINPITDLSSQIADVISGGQSSLLPGTEVLIQTDSFFSGTVNTDGSFTLNSGGLDGGLVDGLLISPDPSLENGGGGGGGDSGGDPAVNGHSFILSGNFRTIARDGNDTLNMSGTTANSTVIAGNGNDTITGSQGNNLISVGNGNNYISIEGNGNNTILAGSGLDTIYGGAGNDLIALAGSGAQLSLFTGLDFNELTGDAIVLGDGNNTVIGGNGSDVIAFGLGSNTIIGGSGSDLIQPILFFPISAYAPSYTAEQVARAGDDLIVGGSQGSTLIGGFSNNTICGGAGNDVIGAGANFLEPMWSLAPELKHFVVSGGDGNDTITGALGDNTLYGGAGDDLIFGTPWQNNPGNSVLIGGEGNDTLVAGGELSQNFPTATNGYATLLGGAGNDLLDGRRMHATMSGGSGEDTYYVDNPNDIVLEAPNEGTDTVYSAISYALPNTVENLTWSGDRSGFGWDLVSPLSTLTLTGNNGDNVIEGPGVLDGGRGDDTLIGDAAVDPTTLATETTYVFGRGYGHDTVIENNALRPGMNHDHIQMMAGVLPSDVSLQREGDNLVLSIKGTPDTLTLQSFYTEDLSHPADPFPRQINQVRFADGTIWDQSVLGGVTVGEANAADTYTFGRGSGAVAVVEYNPYGPYGARMTLQLGPDITPSDVTVQQRDENLILGLAGTTDQFTSELFFHDPAYQLQQVTFADGTVWDTNSLEDHVSVLIATQPNEALIGGSAGNDVLQGRGANDSLYGGSGNDTLDGSGGTDFSEWLAGRAGNDTYVFDRGYGQDRIIDYNYTGADLNTIQMGVDLFGVAPIKPDTLRFEFGSE